MHDLLLCHLRRVPELAIVDGSHSHEEALAYNGSQVLQLSSMGLTGMHGGAADYVTRRQSAYQADDPCCSTVRAIVAREHNRLRGPRGLVQSWSDSHLRALAASIRPLRPIPAATPSPHILTGANTPPPNLDLGSARPEFTTISDPTPVSDPTDSDIQQREQRLLMGALEFDPGDHRAMQPRRFTKSATLPRLEVVHGVETPQELASRSQRYLEGSETIAQQRKRVLEQRANRAKAAASRATPEPEVAAPPTPSFTRAGRGRKQPLPPVHSRSVPRRY